MQAVPRHAKSRVVEALADTRIVVIQGARQVGKTTLIREIVEERGGRLASFDDPVVAAGARDDPIGFLSANPDQLLAIDEVQRVPELILALKYVVDRDPRPGRFLLTGSADLKRLPAIEDSLAGRTESIELHSFSQGELTRHVEAFVDRLMSGDVFSGHASALHRHDYLERAAAGGYPEALARAAGRRRDSWFDNYADSIVRREADDVSKLQRVSDLPRILRVLAARNSAELNVASVARDVGIPARTLGPYLELLRTLYLIQELPAWSTNLSKRVVSRPKVSLLDSGLAANADFAGGLLEGFVAGEVRRQLGWSEEPVRLGHFRDPDVGEVDLVLETPDGRVAGIEVKASASPASKDAKGLRYLRDKLGDRFVAGVVLHTGINAAPFSDRIAAVPMDIVWTA